MNANKSEAIWGKLNVRDGRIFNIVYGGSVESCEYVDTLSGGETITKVDKNTFREQESKGLEDELSLYVDGTRNWLRGRPGHDCPKEIAYIASEEWQNAGGSEGNPQTKFETALLDKTTPGLLDGLKENTGEFMILDCGAGYSMKAFKLIDEILNRGWTLEAYIALDLDAVSVDRQLKMIRDKAAEIKDKNGEPTKIFTAGFVCEYKDYGVVYQEIPQGNRLICSFGSIILNGPDAVCDERLEDIKKTLTDGDRLIIGQDGISKSPGDPYDVDGYYNWMYDALQEGVHLLAGIEISARKAWKMTSGPGDRSEVVEEGLHYFEITAQENFNCERYYDTRIQRNRKFKLFKSWKRTEEWMRNKIESQHGLAVDFVEKADGDTEFRQYIIRKQGAK